VLVAKTAPPPMPQTSTAAAFIARAPAKHEMQKLLYVTDNTFSSGSFITTYRVDAIGNAKPVGVIKGYDTQLQCPNGIVVDARGEIYLADSSKNEILGFAPGSTGDAAPNVVITGSTLQQPGGLAIDAAGNLYTVSCGSDCGASGPDNVTVSPPGSNGNATPAAVISGSNTQFDRVSSVAVDAAGNIYVSNLFGNSIVVFPPGSNGNVAPIDVIAGSTPGSTRKPSPRIIRYRIRCRRRRGNFRPRHGARDLGPAICGRTRVYCDVKDPRPSALPRRRMRKEPHEKHHPVSQASARSRLRRRSAPHRGAAARDGRPAFGTCRVARGACDAHRRTAAAHLGPFGAVPNSYRE
jgi:hypothetical protein